MYANSDKVGTTFLQNSESYDLNGGRVCVLISIKV
mgnify:CR=1 FL=1